VEKLVELHYRTLFRFARKLCDSPATAMVLTQRTFKEALKRPEVWPLPANVRLWLVGILLNQALDH